MTCIFAALGSLGASACAVPQTPSSSEGASYFEEYFKLIAVQKNFSKSYPTLEKLVQLIQTMRPADVVDGLAVIDKKIDATMTTPQDYYAKNQAVFLTGYIGSRSDGHELMASQTRRLATMLNEPSHQFTPPAFTALKMIGYRHPQLVIPILKDALEDPGVNNKTGPGSGISVLLLRLAPDDEDAVRLVVEYMRRPDMTDDHLLDTIVGIDSSPIPDAVTAELVRCLERPNEIIKGRALVGISRSSPAARRAAQLRVQRMANDPSEAAHIRRLAAQALEGKIAGNPDIDK